MALSVNLSTAVLCIYAQCFPALIGPDTPTGEFTLVKRYTNAAGYGGDVLQFHESKTHIFAIHRPWTLRPEQRRLERLQSDDPAQRMMTGGCINVSDELYELLRDCCQGLTITITR